MTIKTNGRKSVLILTLLWMLVIFLFSSQPADKSTETSLFIGQMVESICVPGYVDLSDGEKRIMAENIDFFVRKAAHATEYAVLGMLLSLSVGEFAECSFRERQRAAFIFGAFYAVTDELHQIFVPGRAGLLRDVLIDSAGVLAGLLAIYVFKKITEMKICRKRLFLA
ncbi:MAG: VanZ family protein [Oribacterium sp.]|nr:VanZ family protein [Oribacterium sp.]MBP3806565.1 VanZ family protein [Oribacterium sp.]